MSGNLAFKTFAILALSRAFGQEVPSIPSWLESYPGSKPEIHSAGSSVGSIVESTYTATADPADIVEHYRKLFETAGLPFQSNPDGVGTSIRAAARECDLLIQIRSRPEGARVNVSCSAKIEASSPTLPGDVKVITSRPQSTRAPTTFAPQRQTHRSPEEWMEEHKRKVAEMGIHREHHDAPAPPLVWPSWLTHVNGAAVRAQASVDQSKNAMLRAEYTTNAPMTEIYRFYQTLLSSHEYPTRSQLSTGQTMSGVQQNALGYVEGSNYPDGAPGASTEIKINFSRSVLNGPITVTMRFTTHEYIAKRGY